MDDAEINRDKQKERWIMRRLQEGLVIGVLLLVMTAGKVVPENYSKVAICGDDRFESPEFVETVFSPSLIWLIDDMAKKVKVLTAEKSVAWKEGEIFDLALIIYRIIVKMGNMKVVNQGRIRMALAYIEIAIRNNGKENSFHLAGQKGAFKALNWCGAFREGGGTYCHSTSQTLDDLRMIPGNPLLGGDYEETWVVKALLFKLVKKLFDENFFRNAELELPSDIPKKLEYKYPVRLNKYVKIQELSELLQDILEGSSKKK